MPDTGDGQAGSKKEGAVLLRSQPPSTPQHCPYLIMYSMLSILSWWQEYSRWGPGTFANKLHRNHRPAEQFPCGSSDAERKEGTWSCGFCQWLWPSDCPGGLGSWMGLWVPTGAALRKVDSWVSVCLLYYVAYFLFSCTLQSLLFLFTLFFLLFDILYEVYRHISQHAMQPTLACPQVDSTPPKCRHARTQSLETISVGVSGDLVFPITSFRW